MWCRLWRVVVAVPVVACGSDTKTPSGPPFGSDIEITETTAAHDMLGDAQLVDLTGLPSGTSAVLRPAPGYRELDGFFHLAVAPNGMVELSMANIPAGTSAGSFYRCSGNITITVGITVLYSFDLGTCAATTATADAQGTIVLDVQGSTSDGNEQDLVISLY